MHPAIIAVIAVSSAMTYFMIGAFAATKLSRLFNTTVFGANGPEYIMAGLFWPISLPCVAGYWIATYKPKPGIPKAKIHNG